MPIPEKYVLPRIDRAAQDAAFDQHRQNLNVVLWDRASSINGVPADHWLGRHDTPATGEIYLIQEDGHTIVFQPHHPQGGPMAYNEAEATGADHADQIAAGRVAQELAPPRLSPG